MKFSEWVKLRINNWLIRPDDVQQSNEVYHDSVDCIRGECSRINFDVIPCNDGIIIQIRYTETTGKNQGDDYRRIHIVNDHDSLGAKIQEIFAMENLRRC